MSSDVRENPELHRFEIIVDGRLAGFTSYRRADAETINLIHTEIDPGFEGQGLGNALIGRTLDELRRRDVAVLPSCQFVRAYIGKHSDYLDLVPLEQRSRYGLSASEE